MSEALTESLRGLIGDKGLIALAEAFGGRRLYVPAVLSDDHPIIQAIGADRAARLNRRYSNAWLRVPLARELRARHYRAQGDSNAAIAGKLGMTETSINKLFRRMDNPPAKGSAQLALRL
ncbi:MAG: hypothetical protein J0I69_02845 [Altererythrobacter sp.]|nr:hypothetical protein [Altererythrobacter sp.]